MALNIPMNPAAVPIAFEVRSSGGNGDQIDDRVDEAADDREHAHIKPDNPPASSAMT
ncbi:MAG: hypothetical protein R3C45_21460 [Phycisphaerales bacterium]